MFKHWLLLLAISLHASDLRVSEVMSNPQGSEYENEFVEIYNTGDRVIHINGWTLSDGAGVDSLTHLAGPQGIEPQSFGVILDPGYDFTEDLYTLSQRDSLSLYTISTDASFGSGGLANSGEEVHLTSPDSSEHTWMTWSTSTENGHSWERVELASSDSSANWLPSLHINGSPGFRNSVSPPQINLGVASLQILLAETGHPVQLMLHLTNTGIQAIPFAEILLFQDSNLNGIPDASEWQDLSIYPKEIQPHKLIDVTLEGATLHPGVFRYGCQILVPDDEIPDDDLVWIQVAGAYPNNALSINEIMASPDPDQGSEWIEIINQLDEAVTLAGWSLADANQTRHDLATNGLVIPEDGFLLLARSSEVLEVFDLPGEQVLIPDTWPTLNASSDSIRLFDGTGKLICRAFYRGSWGEAGRSLERRHPTLLPLDELNWAPSSHLDGGTPLAPNSQLLPEVSLELASIHTIALEAFGPGPIQLDMEYLNTGLTALEDAWVHIDDIGHALPPLAPFDHAHVTMTIPRVPAGVSTLLLQVEQDDHLLLDSTVTLSQGFQPGLLTINEIHHLPHSGASEFLEFINISDDTLTLDGWTLEDRSGTRSEGFPAQPVAPHSYILLCEDDSRMPPIPDSTALLQVAPWPSLNNSMDTLWLRDPVGTAHITHGYTSLPGASTGISLERRALWKAHEDPDNWGASTAPQGMTPGEVNSLHEPPVNLALSSMDLLQETPLLGESLDLELYLANRGRASISQAQLALALAFQHHVAWDTSFQSYDLPAGSEVNEQVSFILPQCGWAELSAWIQHPEDEHATDDTLKKEIYIGCLSTPLILTEIFPLPPNNSPEWVEIHNRGGEPVSLKDWSISDASSSLVQITGDEVLLPPGISGLLVEDGPELPLSFPVTWVWRVDLPTMNNSDDQIKLHDPHDRTVDQVSYTADMLDGGRSLERIRRQATGGNNWGLSIDPGGATPGRLNSLDLTEFIKSIDVTCHPNPFYPNNGSGQGQLEIDFELPFPEGQVRIHVYNMAGRRIATPVAHEAVAARGRMTWDGRTDRGLLAATGLYLLKFMADDLNGQVYEVLEKIYLLR